MVSAAGARPPTRHRVIELLMKLMFSPVFGWREKEPRNFPRLNVIGIDQSNLSIGLAPVSQGPPKGVVLLCHPFLKYGMNYFWRNGYHEWLTEAGYHVVSFDFKGFGCSKLSGISFADDVTSMAAWIRRRYPGLPLHLFGASFGAYHGIHCLAQHGELFASAVFDSVPARISDFFTRGLTAVLMRRISHSRWAERTGTHSILDSLPLIGNLPCLFIYGRGDKYLSSALIDHIAETCRGATVRMYDDCGHLEIRKAHGGDYVKTIVDFIESHAVRNAWGTAVAS